jgi:mono/diheme cytochrome c family protein
MNHDKRTIQWIKALAGLAIMLMVAQMGAQAQQLDSEAVIKPKMSPELNLGKLNYQAYCAECHGKNAVGTDKGPTFLHRVYHPGHHADFAFIKAAKEGARAHHWKFGDMKPVKDVTDAQLKSIIEYVRAVQRANGLF